MAMPKWLKKVGDALKQYGPAIAEWWLKRKK
jgi:hypothetical protein